jgi:3-hydroxy acid dehydrogenase / malonic semialdehyde reductase
VILVARRADALASVKEACIAAHKGSGSQYGGEFATIVLDVGDRPAIKTLWDKIPASLRNIDILGTGLTEICFNSSFLIYGIQVNNAGFVFGVDRVGDIPESDIEAMFSTNVVGLIAMSQLLVKRESL